MTVTPAGGGAIASVERVNVYIDGSNLYHALRENGYAPRLNFGRLLRQFTADRRLGRAYSCSAPVRLQDGAERYRSQQRFFEALQAVDYLTVRLGRLEPRGGALVEKGVDVRLAVDMLTHAFGSHYDVAILVSGDGDFAYIIEAVKNLGKHVENAFFTQGRSRELARVSDQFVELTSQFLAPRYE